MKFFLFLGILLFCSQVMATEVRYWSNIAPNTEKCIRESISEVPKEYLNSSKIIVVRNQKPLFIIDGKYLYGYAWYRSRRIDLYLEGVPCEQARHVLFHEIGHLVARDKGLKGDDEEIAEQIAEEITYASSRKQ